MNRLLNKLRALRHRWTASLIRRRVERDRADLEEFYTAELFRLSARSTRAGRHESRAEQLDPTPKPQREPRASRRAVPALGRGLDAILTSGGPK